MKIGHFSPMLCIRRSLDNLSIKGLIDFMRTELVRRGPLILGGNRDSSKRLRGHLRHLEPYTWHYWPGKSPLLWEICLYRVSWRLAKTFGECCGYNRPQSVDCQRGNLRKWVQNESQAPKECKPDCLQKRLCPTTSDYLCRTVSHSTIPPQCSWIKQ